MEGGGGEDQTVQRYESCMPDACTVQGGLNKQNTQPSVFGGLAANFAHRTPRGQNDTMYRVLDKFGDMG